MRIIARKTLIDFWKKWPDSEEPLKAWFKVASEAEWKHPQDIKAQYKNASILKDGRAVFNIAGNK
jgi:mRNA interferase HigB